LVNDNGGGLDVWTVLTVVAFVAGCIAYARGCERL
jgi:hypothetical protein